MFVTPEIGLKYSLVVVTEIRQEMLLVETVLNDEVQQLQLDELTKTIDQF